MTQDEIRSIRELAVENDEQVTEMDFEELTIDEDDFRDFKDILSSIEQVEGSFYYEDKHSEYNSIVLTGVQVEAPVHLIKELADLAQ